jgi:hypothetical protein
MNLQHEREIVKSYGLRAGIHDVTKRAIDKVIFCKILNVVDLALANANPEFLSLDARFVGRFLRDDELNRYAADPKNDLTASFVKGALTKGDRCYGVLEGDTLASYGWYSQKPTEMDDDLVFHFDPNDVYMYKGFTPKTHRGLRLHAFGMALALEAYTHEGARGLVSYVESNNFASLRSCARLGYKDVGHVYVARLRDRSVMWRTGKCEAHGVWVDDLLKKHAGHA